MKNPKRILLWGILLFCGACGSQIASLSPPTTSQNFPCYQDTLAHLTTEIYRLEQANQELLEEVNRLYNRPPEVQTIRVPQIQYQPTVIKDGKWGRKEEEQYQQQLNAAQQKVAELIKNNANLQQQVQKFKQLINAYQQQLEQAKEEVPPIKSGGLGALLVGLVWLIKEGLVYFKKKYRKSI